MNEDIRIRTDDLKRIVNDINMKKNQIMDIYNHSLKSILYSCENTLLDSGYNFVEIEDSFMTLFNDFNNFLDEFVRVLSDGVISNYEDLNSNLKNLFNNELSNGLNDLLGIDSRSS